MARWELISSWTRGSDMKHRVYIYIYLHMHRVYSLEKETLTNNIYTDTCEMFPSDMKGNEPPSIRVQFEGKHVYSMYLNLFNFEGVRLTIAMSTISNLLWSASVKDLLPVS